jgi:hypothetical protein
MPDRDEGYWQTQADLVRSGALSRETTTLATAHQLAELGRTGYMNLYPETFRDFAPFRYAGPSWQEIELEKLRGLLSEYYGPEGATIRWLVQNRMKDLQYQIQRQTGNVKGTRPPEYEPFEIPSWAQPFIQTKTVPIELRGRVRRGTPTTKEVKTLKPLGAQTELSPEKMGWLAGFQAWQKAGTPTRYSDTALRQMSDWERWWSPYTTLSQSLFPKTKQQTPRWATATQ